MATFRKLWMSSSESGSSANSEHQTVIIQTHGWFTLQSSVFGVTVTPPTTGPCRSAHPRQKQVYGGQVHETDEWLSSCRSQKLMARFLFGFHLPSVLPTWAGEIWTDPWFKSCCEWFSREKKRLKILRCCWKILVNILLLPPRVG